MSTMFLGKIRGWSILLTGVINEEQALCPKTR
jgi:hypothetical protein